MIHIGNAAIDSLSKRIVRSCKSSSRTQKKRVFSFDKQKQNCPKSVALRDKTIRKANEPRPYRPAHLYSLTLFRENRPACRISFLLSYTFVVIPSSSPLNERLISCLPVLFVAFLPFGFLGRSLAGLPARPYRHSIASASLFSTLSPHHISALPTRRPHSSSLCVADFPLPSRVYPLPYYPTRSVYEKKNGEKRPLARDGKSKVPPPISPHD